MGKGRDWNNISDEELINEYLISLENHIFKVLYLRYKDKIFFYIKNFLYYASEEVILDIVDETFIRAYAKLSDLKEKKFFKSWLYRIAHNLCVDFLKDQEKEIISDMESYKSQIDNRVDIEKQAIDKELLKFIYRTIDTFNNEIREIIILKFFHNLTYREIANIVKKPERSVRYQLDKALIDMEIKIRKEGFL